MIDEELTLKQTDELGDRFKVFAGPDALADAPYEQMTSDSVIYTLVAVAGKLVYMLGAYHLVNRTGVYAIRKSEEGG